jgi:outer membrane protein W
LRLSIALLLVLAAAGLSGQVFVVGMGGAAALSGASVVRAAPASASNYDPKVGTALNFAAGYHFNDWVSAQAGYVWNRNLLITRQLTAGIFFEQQQQRAQHAIAFDAMLYFRARSSRLRPYLSAGPGVVRVLDQHKAGLRVAVGIDVKLRTGWFARYSFSEMASGNPFAEQLNPPASGRLMNFQNLFGIGKVF